MMKRVTKFCCKSTFIAVLVFALTGAALAQSKSPKNLYEALAAQGVPTMIHAEEMTTDWHVFSLGLTGIFDRSFYDNSSNERYDNFYYTKGELISFGATKYLVAYRLSESSDPDQSAALDYYNAKPNDKTPPRRTPILLKNSPMTLALLAFNQSQNFREIQKFNPVLDTAKALSKAELERRMSQANLKQIGLAMAMYVQDYDEVYPPMIAARNADEVEYSSFDVPPPPMPPGSYDPCTCDHATVQDRLSPYTKDSQIFLQPVTGRPYLPNYKISRKPVSQFKNPSQIFLFYEDAPNTALTRNVVYADGHVKELSEEEFQRQRKAQGISESGYPSAVKPARKAKRKS